MRPPSRAATLLAMLPGLACAFWEEPPPESYALPPIEFPTPEIDVPLLRVEARSALWLAKSPIGSFYLFGSTESSDEAGYGSFGANVEAAYAASQEVVQEIDLDATDPAGTIALMRRYGTLKRPRTLQSQISRETWALLEGRFAEAGRSAETVQTMQPWLVSFALANHASIVDARDPIPGIADRVRERARSARTGSAKPVVGLRTLASQFRMLAAMPRNVQDSLLRSALGGGPLAGLDLALVQRVWMNEDWYASLREPTRSEVALLYEYLVYRPNEQMADRLFQIGIDGKLRFVAVGIVHLVGDRGIPALLGQRGFHLSRVQ
jgi:uncharacterized protein